MTFTSSNGHIHTSQLRFLLWNKCIMTRKTEEAIKLCEWSIEMNRAIHGEKSAHQGIAIMLDNLGVVYQGPGKLKEAVKIY